MERGSAPADGMASCWGIVVALVGFEPTTPPYKRVALTAGLQSHVAALPGGGRIIYRPDFVVQVVAAVGAEVLVFVDGFSALGTVHF